MSSLKLKTFTLAVCCILTENELTGGKRLRVIGLYFVNAEMIRVRVVNASTAADDLRTVSVRCVLLIQYHAVDWHQFH